VGQQGQPTQQVYTNEMGEYKTYVVSTLDCQATYHRSGNTLQEPKPPMITGAREEKYKKQKLPDTHPEIQNSFEAKQNNPSFPEKLNQTKPPTQPSFDIIEELKNMYVKIQLMRTIKDISIHNKVIKDL